jgi:hypothetical protein
MSKRSSNTNGDLKETMGSWFWSPIETEEHGQVSKTRRKEEEGPINSRAISPESLMKRYLERGRPGDCVRAM